MRPVPLHLRRVPWNLSLALPLKKEAKRFPLPGGVKWSDVFQVVVMAVVAEIKGVPKAEFRKLLSRHPQGDVIRAWALNVLS
jgi:hypothetical protein